jgi:hypothetical protein
MKASLYSKIIALPVDSSYDELLKLMKLGIENASNNLRLQGLLKTFINSLCFVLSDPDSLLQELYSPELYSPKLYSPKL